MGWALCALLASTTAGARARAEVQIGAPLPAMRLPSTTGKQVAVSAKGNKALLLIYLRADQERSSKALEELAALHGRYKAKGVGALAVATGLHEGAVAAAKLARELKLAFPLLVDGKGTFRDKGYIVYPTTVVADGGSRVRHVFAGHRAGYAITLERQLRAVLGIGPPPEEIEDRDRNAASVNERREQRLGKLEQMRRRVELKRARRRFKASVNVCDEKNIAAALEIYAAWAALLPPPAEPRLAAAAAKIEAGARQAVAALRTLSAEPKLQPEVWLWLGRALARAGETAEAEKVLARCTGKKAALLGQCELELSRLVAGKDAARAVALFKQGHGLAFPSRE